MKDDFVYQKYQKPAIKTSITASGVYKTGGIVWRKDFKTRDALVQWAKDVNAHIDSITTTERITGGDFT